MIEKPRRLTKKLTVWEFHGTSEIYVIRNASPRQNTAKQGFNYTRDLQECILEQMIWAMKTMLNQKIPRIALMFYDVRQNLILSYPYNGNYGFVSRKDSMSRRRGTDWHSFKHSVISGASASSGSHNFQYAQRWTHIWLRTKVHRRIRNTSQDGRVSSGLFSFMRAWIFSASKHFARAFSTDYVS